MSDFTTGGINFGYKSPITRIMSDIQTQIIQEGENQVFQAVQNCDVMVDREELIKALQYDRGQYEKGYKDGAIAELEKIKVEVQEMSNANPSYWYTCDVVDRAYLIDMIDERISELKGENKPKCEDCKKSPYNINEAGECYLCSQGYSNEFELKGENK